MRLKVGLSPRSEVCTSAELWEMSLQGEELGGRGGEGGEGAEDQEQEVFIAIIRGPCPTLSGATYQ